MWLVVHPTAILPFFSLKATVTQPSMTKDKCPLSGAFLWDPVVLPFGPSPFSSFLSGTQSSAWKGVGHLVTMRTKAIAKHGKVESWKDPGPWYPHPKPSGLLPLDFLLLEEKTPKAYLLKTVLSGFCASVICNCNWSSLVSFGNFGYGWCFLAGKERTSETL